MPVESRLNAPFGARCFLTPERIEAGVFWNGLNAPFGARCFLTRAIGEIIEYLMNLKVLMHLLALGAF